MSRNTINYGNNAKSNNHLNSSNVLNAQNSLDVVDVSEDETSITSVKGEGFASDLSDTEIRNQPHLKLSQRSKPKKALSSDQNPKRPTTPMDIRMQENQKPAMRPQNESALMRGMKMKNQQIGENNIQQPTGRFNEWDPYSVSRQQQQQQQLNQNERQKSPHSKNRPLLQQQQQQQLQPSSNFAHTFLNTDSSPRQSSGRSQLGSATNTTNQKLIMSPQQQQQQINDMNSASNLDLVISGQKLGGRKDLSPTNTPRDLTQIQQTQQIALHRPFTRRLQPLDKLAQESLISAAQSNEAQLLRPSESQLLRPADGQLLRSNEGQIVLRPKK